MGQYAVTIVIAVLVLAFVIYQQVRTRPINLRQLVLVPVILAFLGITNLDKHPPDSTAAGVALVASIVIAIILGFGRGVSTEIWRSGGVLLRKGGTVTLILWVVAIALRIVIAIIAQREGVNSSVTTGEIPLFLGVTLAAQNVVIWLRGERTIVESGELVH